MANGTDSIPAKLLKQRCSKDIDCMSYYSCWREAGGRKGGGSERGGGRESERVGREREERVEVASIYELLSFS